jgi:hypothetical protein
LCKYTFAQRRNRLTTHFSECFPVVERRISVFWFSPRPRPPTPFQNYHTSFILSFDLCLTWYKPQTNIISHEADSPFCHKIRSSENLRLIFRSTHLKTQHRHFHDNTSLTLILLTWKIRWAPNNASKWQMGFNSASKGLFCTTNFTYTEYVHQKLANLHHASAHQGAIIREAYRLPSLRSQNGPMCLNMLETC